MYEIENFSINNLQAGSNANLIRNLLEMIIEKGQKIKKLRFSNMILNDEKTVDLLTQVISTFQGDLVSIKISNCSLTPKSLGMISKVLKENPYYIKKIDLSYNTLNFQNSKVDNIIKDKMYSLQFV